MSYNTEGIIPQSLRSSGCSRLTVVRSTYQRYRRAYRRYRSDADSEIRNYVADEVFEDLYCVDR